MAKKKVLPSYDRLNAFVLWLTFSLCMVNADAIQPSSSSSSPSSSSSTPPPLVPQVPFGGRKPFPKGKRQTFPLVGGQYSHPILLPRDILYHEPTKIALQILRRQNEPGGVADADNVDADTNASPPISPYPSAKEAIESLYRERVCNDHAATLTLVGYKGRGGIHDQINQDRAFVHSPFEVFPQGDHIHGHVHDGDDDTNDTSRKHETMQLMGVMDGHGHLGEHVSEYCVSNIPKILKESITEIVQKQKNHTVEGALTANGKNGEVGEDKNDTSSVSTTASVKNMLRDVFSTINATIPTNRHGGCTASITFRCGNKIYVANVGDSRTFLFTHSTHGYSNHDDVSNGDGYDYGDRNVHLIYESREDKPHLQGEKERIEECGGIVYIPPKNSVEAAYDSSRVIIVDRERGQQLSLAMSRSLGDWSFSNYGVISEPIVDVIDLDEVKAKSTKSCEGEDVNVFVVSATDGLLDYVTPEVLGEILGRALYEHPLKKVQGTDQHFLHHSSSALEEMVLRAAQGWYNDMGPTYRDDIAIAVMKVL